MKAYICIGIAASGKTTWAKEFVKTTNDGVIVCRDDIRRTMMGGNLVWSKWKWSDESKVTAVHTEMLEEAARRKCDIIVADTNLNPKHRNALINKLKALGYDIEIKDFPISLKEAWKRDAQRESGVGHDVIYRQWKQWLEYINYKTYTPDTTKAPALIVDIDGTLAHMDGRSPYDWDRVHTDKVDEVIKTTVNMWHETAHIIIVSGRDGACREMTQKWLDDNGINHLELLMRQAGDMRNDSIVKEEIFWRDIADNYNVLAVIDDRPQVVRTWLDLGLKVLIVGNPYLEF